MKDTKALVSADELAKDVAGAEALIQRHRERKGEIDAQEDSFKATNVFGHSLISSGHYATQEVKNTLESLAGEKSSLLELWEERRAQFDQCMELQLFMRDAEQADNWMAKQEVNYSIPFPLSQYSTLVPIPFHSCPHSIPTVVPIPFHLLSPFRSSSSHFLRLRMWETLWTV